MIYPKITVCAEYTKTVKIMDLARLVSGVGEGKRRFSRLHIEDADLTALNGVDLEFRGCTFENVDFSNAQLEGLDCNNCSFINCKFVGANLQEAAFQDTTFFRASTKTIFWRANLRLATFSDCDLRMCDFERAELFRSEFSNVNGMGTNFLMASFENATKIVDSAFRYAVFTGAQMEKCTLTNNVFIQAVFQGAKLAGAILLGCDLSGATWLHADLRGADVRGANIPSLDVRSMNLAGIKIYESQQRQLLETAEVIIFPDGV